MKREREDSEETTNKKNKINPRPKDRKKNIEYDSKSYFKFNF